MRRAPWWLALVVSVAGVGRVAAAQDPALALLKDEAARESIRSTVERVSAKGVPTGALFTKVREGVAKDAPPARIADAVGLMAARLELAHDALAVAVSPDEVTAGAAAIQVGVGAPVLKALRQRFTTTALTVPLGVMTQLVASGVPVTRAVTQIRLLLERGATPTQLVALTTAVQADVAAGVAPDVAFGLRTDATLGAATSTAPSTGTGTTTGSFRPPPIRPKP